MTDVEFEEHPYPERPVARLGGPAAAAVLTAVVFGVAFLAPEGGVRIGAIVVLLVLHVVLIVARGRVLRRGGHATDGPFRLHQFLFAWGWWTGGQVVVGPEGPVNALVTGLVFAVILVLLLWLLERRRQKVG